MLLSYPATVNDLDPMKPKVGPNGAPPGHPCGMVKEVLIIDRQRNTRLEYFPCRAWMRKHPSTIAGHSDCTSRYANRRVLTRTVSWRVLTRTVNQRVLTRTVSWRVLTRTVSRRVLTRNASTCNPCRSNSLRRGRDCGYHSVGTSGQRHVRPARQMKARLSPRPRSRLAPPRPA
jgi:hypothetical protein